MIWVYGFAVFGVVCAVAIVGCFIAFIRGVDKNGWNQ